MFFAIKEKYLNVLKRNSQNAAHQQANQEIQIIDPDMPQPLPEVKKESGKLSAYEQWNKDNMEKELKRTESYTVNEKFFYVLS